MIIHCDPVTMVCSLPLAFRTAWQATYSLVMWPYYYPTLPIFTFVTLFLQFTYYMVNIQSAFTSLKHYNLPKWKEGYAVHTTSSKGIQTFRNGLKFPLCDILIQPYTAHSITTIHCFNDYLLLQTVNKIFTLRQGAQIYPISILV